MKGREDCSSLKFTRRMGIIKNGRKERDGIRMEMQGKGKSSGRKYWGRNNEMLLGKKNKGR